MRPTRPLSLLFSFLFLILLGRSSYAQSAEELFRNGYEAQEEGRPSKALEYYDRAIDRDDSLKEAYINRASILIAMDQYEKARSDLSRTIELDPDYLRAYYNRANIFVEEGLYRKAEEDLNELLERDSDHREALLLRGQVRQHLDKEEKGCRDLRKAREQGAKKASNYIERFCEPREALELKSRWPTPSEWNVVNRTENEEMKRIELVKEGDDYPEWKTLGSVTALKYVRDIPMDTARFFLSKQAKGKCEDIQVRTLEKKNSGEDPYIFFILNCSAHINTRKPETQLWYVEQGERHLYAYFIAVQEERMNLLEQEKWMEFLR